MTINDLGKLARLYNPQARTDHILALKRHIPPHPSDTTTMTMAMDPAQITALQQQLYSTYYSTATGISSTSWPTAFGNVAYKFSSTLK